LGISYVRSKKNAMGKHGTAIIEEALEDEEKIKALIKRLKL
jgi:hypothetical protein